jgi:hypothetical protein
MAEVITFDPQSEFELLDEPFEFEEEVQRSEAERFFTLPDQLNDWFQKMLPKDKGVSKFEIKRLAKERDRMEEAYTNTVTVTDAEYKVDRMRTSLNISWIKGIYEDFSYRSYSFEKEWVPLLAKENLYVPQYYNRMITALPHPYTTTGKEGVLLENDMTLVDENSEKTIHALGNYKRSKTVIHEDGTLDVVLAPIGNTSDNIRIKGYFIEKRELEIPNPLADHPFLASNQSSKVITNEPLLDIFPTIQTIMTHGVPTTTDPYGEGLKYLKVYDVKLNEIAWESWKHNFPTVHPITATPPTVSVKFPDQDAEAQPAKSLQDSYTYTWGEGIAPRFWLMNQEDGGLFVPKMLLSKANEHGNVAVIPIEAQPPVQYPFSTPDECYTFDTFESLTEAGVYRSPAWNKVNKAVDDREKGKLAEDPKGTCVSVGFIQEEQKKLISHGRIPWNEEMGHKIIEDHLKLLKKFQKFTSKNEQHEKFEKFEKKNKSEMRKHVLSILSDTERTDLDKAIDIEKLAITLTLKDNVYTDKEDLFVICQHTLAVLKGELEEDRLEFYNNWTSIIDGSRTCKYCGEEVNKDVFVAQDEFDSNGVVQINYDTLVVSEFKGDTQFLSFAGSLREIQKMFIVGRTSEDVLYLLLSLLQVLPEGKQLLPILQTVREVAESVRRAPKIPQAGKDRVEGILGIIGCVFLLQIHNPFLYPRRAVSKLTGYPRDSDDPKKADVVFSLMSVLKAPYESNPNLFKGPTTEIFKEIINNPRKVKDEAVRLMAPFIAKFKTQLEEAKLRYEETVPTEIKTKQMIEMPLIVVSKTEYNPTDIKSKEELPAVCTTPAPHVFFEGTKSISVSQDILNLWDKMTPSASSIGVSGLSVDPQSFKFTEAEIRKMKSGGIPKAFSKLEKLTKFLNSKEDAIAFLTLFNRLLDILSTHKYDIEELTEYRTKAVYLSADKSLTKDIATGLTYELLEKVGKSAALVKVISEAVKRDVVLQMIFLTSEEAAEENEALRTSERESLKKKLRTMNDTSREITKMLLDIGIADFLITNADREFFARQYANTKSELEEAKEVDGDMPEEGYNDTRDYVENGDVPVGGNGVELQVDYGDYGDRAVRDYDDYANVGGVVDDGEGFGN